MEPLAIAVQEAIDAQGWKPADASRATGLSTQLLSQILNRKTPYTRPPTIDTMQKLAKIPGLPLASVARAVAESIGLPLPAGPDVPMTPMRRSVHGVVDQIGEDDLPRALKVLTGLL